MNDLKKENRSCMVDGCTNGYKARGYCNKHYCAWKRHGDPLIQTKVCKGYWDDTECSVDNCTRPVRTMGICSMHYLRDFRLKQNGLPMRYRDE